MKINCPYHDDDHPSMEVYADGFAHCFVCAAHVPVEELGIKKDELPKEEKPIENIQERLQFVQTLPVRNIRGHDFHCDDISYYVVWPSGDYFNRRFFSVQDGQPKYKCPSGHRRPLFVANAGTSRTLIVVEGEINALSIGTYGLSRAWGTRIPCVVSPGSAGDFYSKVADRHLTFYKGFDKIHLVADRDKAGAIACIELKSRLITNVPDVSIHLMSEDANDILVKYGQEKLQEEIEALVLPQGL